MESNAATPRWIVVALLFVTVVSFAARWVGLDSQLPHDPDQVAVPVWQAAALDLPPGKSFTAYAYPSTFYPYLTSRVLAHMPGHSYARPAPVGAALEAHLAAAAEPFRRGRILVAFLTLLMVPGTYFLARRWLEPSWSLLAAVLLATSLLALRVSTQARVHGVVASMGVLAVLSILHMLRRGTLWSAALAGLAASLPICTLYSGLAVLPSLLLAHVLAPARTRALRWLGVAISLGIVAVCFRLGYPFLFDSQLTTSSAPTHFTFGEQSIPWSRLSPRGFVLIARSLWFYDPVLIGLAALGILLASIALLRGRSALTADSKREAWVAVAWPASTLAAFGMLNEALPRFVVPLLPAAAVFGAVAVRALARSTGRTRSASWRSRALAGSLIVAVLALPTYACVRLVRISATPDTQLLAARWLDAHAGLEDRVLVTVPLSLPMFQDPRSLAELPEWAMSPWEIYIRDWADDAQLSGRTIARSHRPGFLKDKRVDRDEARARIEEVQPAWAVVAVAPPEEAGADETRAVLREMVGEPVVRFLPSDDQTASWRELGFAAGFEQFEGFLRVDRHGPPLEIYRLKQ